MRALVVYESLWGNTEEVARAVTRGLEAAGVTVRVTEVVDAPATVPDDVDLVVAGGPTHAFSMTRANTRADAVRQGATHAPGDGGLREWLAGLPSGRGTTPIATFDTRVGKVRHLPGSAAKSAAKAARKHGFRLTDDPHSFYVEDTPGPLAEGEADRAEAWGHELSAALATAR